MLVLLAAPLGYACQCGMPMPVPGEPTDAQVWQMYLDRAGLVAIGTVTTTALVDHGAWQDTTVQLTRVWKGGSVGDTVVVRHTLASPSCGFHAEKGESMALFADRVGDRWEMTYCDLPDEAMRAGTPSDYGPASVAAVAVVEKHLGSGRTPAAPSGGP